MKKITIFLASSNELKPEREQFEIEINRKNKAWVDKGVFFDLKIWEDLSARMSETGSQSEYNKFVRDADLFVLLAYSKVGGYTEEEFEQAFGQFQATKKPFIFTYFKIPPPPDAAESLDHFKKKLGNLKHFYSKFENSSDLWNQFNKELERLQLDQFAVNNWNNTATVTGNNNIVIQGVTNSTITVNVNGESKEIEKKLDALQSLMEQLAAPSIQSANNTYPIGSITNANFGFLVNQAGRSATLPLELAENLVAGDDGWTMSLRQELIKQKISVGNQAMDVFQNYGWLVQTFLQKMNTSVGRERTLRRLSFMAEAWQASLRYLCYIQLAQLLQVNDKPRLGIVSSFIQMENDDYLSFDYSGLFLTLTDTLGENSFMKETLKLAEDITDSESLLYGAVLYLNEQRRKLLNGEIAEDDTLPQLLDEYLTALVYWLRKIAFVAKYRLVSIKDINLSYRLGTERNFVHLYGELHGIYNETGLNNEEYSAKSVIDSFTFNKSVLLFKGVNVDVCMDHIHDNGSYLSLSPLIIDQSVYDNKSTQTPEIFYYRGYDKAKRKYGFAEYKNELPIDGKPIISNKKLDVAAQNNNQPQLDELFEQLDYLFTPLKMKTS